MISRGNQIGWLSEAAVRLQMSELVLVAEGHHASDEHQTCQSLELGQGRASNSTKTWES